MDVGKGRIRGVDEVGAGTKVHAAGILCSCLKSAWGHEESFVLYGHVGERQRKMPIAGLRQVLKRFWGGNAKACVDVVVEI